MPACTGRGIVELQKSCSDGSRELVVLDSVAEPSRISRVMAYIDIDTVSHTVKIRVEGSNGCVVAGKQLGKGSQKEVRDGESMR